MLYESKKGSTLFMVGFNVPTFKVLDVLSIEVERFSSRYPNSSQYSQRDVGKRHGILLPLPQPSIYSNNLPSGYNPDDWTKDDLKWPLFAQRRIINGASLSGQAASDNARGWVYPTGRRYWTLFRKPSDWYWMMKLTASI